MNSAKKNPTTRRTLLSPGPRRPGQRRACVVVIYGEGLGRRISIDNQPILIGRSEDADLQLPHASVSRRHCQIWQEDKQHLIRDLGATNCTRVNDESLGDSTCKLQDGDHITVGESILKFVGHASVEAPYHAEVYQLATHDPLTELCNRRHFAELMDKELARASRHQRDLSLAMIDVDHFKHINDNYGHEQGDQALRCIAEIIGDHARTEDVVGRVGGEEFAVLLPETSARDAYGICERLRVAVRERCVLQTAPDHTVSISIGIATLQPGGSRPALMKLADQALYQAKRSGRNKTCTDADIRDNP